MNDSANQRAICPHCGVRYKKVRPDQVGRRIVCVRCGEPFKLELVTLTDASVGEKAARRSFSETWKPGERLLDLYEVKKLLGEGGFGRVYLVHHNNWKLDLAVKSPTGKAMAAAGGKANFEREAETWVNLGLHPNTVSCHYVRRVDDVPRVFAEYVAGGDLKAWIETGKLYRGTPEEALSRMFDIAIQMAWGLDHAHNAGLIHQDVKPANVMMTPEGTAKVTDFGLAGSRPQPQGGGSDGQTVRLDEQDTLMVDGVGHTPAYASPEQVGKRSLTRRSDLWSWAVSLLHMFTGELLWPSGSVVGALLDRFMEKRGARALQHRIPKIPPPVLDLLRDCFQESADQRPHDMAVVAGRLREIHQRLLGKPHLRLVPERGRNTADSLNNRALSLLDLEIKGQDRRRNQALKLWSEALRTQPGHLESIFNRGLLTWRLAKSTDDAFLRELEESRSLARRPENHIVCESWLHLERNDPSRVLTHLHTLSGAQRQRVEADDLVDLAKNRLNDGWRLMTALEKQDWPVRTLYLSRDASWVLTAGEDRLIKRWRLTDGHCELTCKGHRGAIIALSVSADEGTLISGGADRMLKLWNLADGRCLRTFTGHMDTVSAVALDPGGGGCSPAVSPP